MIREVKLQDLARLHKSIRSELEEAFRDVVESSAFVQGKHVRTFENQFGDFTQASHCVGVANGTDALELGLKAAGIQRGDSVLVPAMTFAATAEAVVNVGATPVFADISPETLCSTEKDFADALRFAKSRVKGVISVYLHGLADRVLEIGDFVASQRLAWIEDCAQAHGTKYDGRHVGTFSKVGTFSFYPGKNLGALGDAGAVITQCSNISTQVFSTRDHGRTEKHLHTFVGRNSRLDGLQAAFLSVKLKHLPRWTQDRRKIADRYFSNLRGRSSLLALPSRPADPERHVYHNFVVRIMSGGSLRDQVVHSLKKSGIETGLHYPLSLNAQQAFKPYWRKLEVADKISQEVISLPIDPLMEPNDVDYVCDNLLKAVAPHE